VGSSLDFPLSSTLNISLKTVEVTKMRQEWQKEDTKFTIKTLKVLRVTLRLSSQVGGTQPAIALQLRRGDLGCMPSPRCPDWGPGSPICETNIPKKFFLPKCTFFSCDKAEGISPYILQNSIIFDNRQKTVKKYTKLAIKLKNNRLSGKIYSLTACNQHFYCENLAG